MSADYVAIYKDGDFAFGPNVQDFHFDFTVPANTDFSLPAILTFNVGLAKGEDKTLHLRCSINDTEIYHYDTPDNTYNMNTVQLVIGSNILKLGPNKNRIKFFRTGGSFGQVQLGMVVLWVQLNPMKGKIRLNPAFADVFLGGKSMDPSDGGVSGDILMYPHNYTIPDIESSALSSIHLQASAGTITLGDGGNVPPSDAGKLILMGHLGEHISLDATNAWIKVGGHGKAGQISVFPPADPPGPNYIGQKPWTINLDGKTGDAFAASFNLTGADCAETFEVDDRALAEPGTVMVIGDDGRLRASDQAYDKRVAGVVAGEGDNRPGIILGNRIGGGSPRAPIALMGRVFCKVDADQAPIKVGDLLTSSSAPGHAMKADDPVRAYCAVLGKALGSLKGGRGLIPVLVAPN